jgi:hypothetical protein
MPTSEHFAIYQYLYQATFYSYSDYLIKYHQTNKQGKKTQQFNFSCLKKAERILKFWKTFHLAD